MAAFFNNPAPLGRDAPRANERPRLTWIWRPGTDGRLVSNWKAETADTLLFKRHVRPRRGSSPHTAVR